jgi:hypothetical protein
VPYGRKRESAALNPRLPDFSATAWSAEGQLRSWLLTSDS